MENDERQEEIEVEVVQAGDRPTGVKVDELVQRPGFETIFVDTEEAKADLQSENRQHRRDTPSPQRVVADDGARATLQIGEDRPGAAKKPGEPGRLAADDAPDQAEEDQAQDRVAGEPVPGQVVAGRRPPGKRHQDDDQPVEEASRKIPEADGR